MMRKMLMVATVPSMIGQFNMNNIEILQNIGYEVHVACDFNDRSVWNDEKVEKLKKQLQEKNVKSFQVDFSRNPLNFFNHEKSYIQMKKLFKENDYDFAHCHTPIASVTCRLVTHKMKVKCIYTAHGFHFYKGAPLKNWLLYYPIEKFLSRWTDLLITINKEDYQIAQKKMHAKENILIPGVGVDIGKFQECNINFAAKRNSLGIEEDDFVLISVGEVNDNKNHRVIIEALSLISDEKVKYVICGQGKLEQKHIRRAKELGLEQRVKFLGYQSDVNSFLHMADLFVFPSKREGLGLAAIEAMVCGLPLLTSNIHGINDYSVNGETGYKCSPKDVKGFAQRICELRQDKIRREKMGKNNREVVQKYDVKNVNEIMKKVYENI